MATRKLNLDEQIIEDPLELTVEGKVYLIPTVTVEYVMRLQQASETVSGTAATETLLEMLAPLGVPREQIMAWSYRKALMAATEIAQHFTSLPEMMASPGAKEIPSSGQTPLPSSSTPPVEPTP